MNQWLSRLAFWGWKIEYSEEDIICRGTGIWFLKLLKKKKQHFLSVSNPRGESVLCSASLAVNCQYLSLGSRFPCHQFGSVFFGCWSILLNHPLPPPRSELILLHPDARRNASLTAITCNNNSTSSESRLLLSESSTSRQKKEFFYVYDLYCEMFFNHHWLLISSYIGMRFTMLMLPQKQLGTHWETVGRRMNDSIPSRVMVEISCKYVSASILLNKNIDLHTCHFRYQWIPCFETTRPLPETLTLVVTSPPTDPVVGNLFWCCLGSCRT